MKIAHYEQMMDYLTGPRERFRYGGRAGFDKGGRIGFAEGLGANISQYKSKGKQLGYKVRSRKLGGTEKVFSKEKYGSLANALKAAQEYRKETLKNLITNEEYLKLRNQHKEKSAKEFSEYLRKETNFKPRRGDEFTREGVKTRDREVKFETTRAFTKRTLAPKIEEEIYQKYLKAVKEGKREGTIIGLGREYLPGLTRSQQENTIARILKEKGVDLSPFKKVGTGEKAATQVTRRERLGTAKKLAGSSAGQLSDEIILDIKAMNDKVKNMSLEDIAANKKYINSMRINATMDNLSKGVIPFDKYKDLTDLELAKKIKDRADVNKFFDVEHISSVKGQKRNLYYPNNIQMAPGQFGSLMDNFKRIADEQPNNPILSKVDEVLSEYNLTVRNPETKIRLGNKAIIEVSDGTSNIVKSNFEAVNTPFEKQTVTKPAPLKKTPSAGPTLKSRVPVVTDLFEMAKSIPDDIKRAKYLKAGFKTLGIAAAPLVIYDTYNAYKQGKPILETLEQGLIGTDIIGGTKRFMSLTPEERDARAIVKQDALKDLNIDIPAGLGFIEGPDPTLDLTLEEARAKAAAGDERVKQLEAQRNLDRATDRSNFFGGIKDKVLPPQGIELAGGGIAKEAGEPSGPPPESGPTPQGLDFLLNRGRKR